MALDAGRGEAVCGGGVPASLGTLAQEGAGEVKPNPTRDRAAESYTTDLLYV